MDNRLLFASRFEWGVAKSPTQQSHVMVEIYDDGQMASTPTIILPSREIAERLVTELVDNIRKVYGEASQKD